MVGSACSYVFEAGSDRADRSDVCNVGDTRKSFSEKYDDIMLHTHHLVKIVTHRKHVSTCQVAFVGTRPPLAKNFGLRLHTVVFGTRMPAEIWFSNLTATRRAPHLQQALTAQMWRCLLFSLNSSLLDDWRAGALRWPWRESSSFLQVFVTASWRTLDAQVLKNLNLRICTRKIVCIASHSRTRKLR